MSNNTNSNEISSCETYRSARNHILIQSIDGMDFMEELYEKISNANSSMFEMLVCYLLVNSIMHCLLLVHVC